MLWLSEYTIFMLFGPQNTKIIPNIYGLALVFEIITLSWLYVQ